MENPYESPTAETQPRQSAWVTQVRVVAVLLIIQGVLECGVGLLLVYQWQKSHLAVAVILLVFILGALKTVAGLANYRYRYRALGLVALAAAPLSIFTFLCLPSAIVIFVYGLVVYLHGDARRAFGKEDGGVRP